MYQCLCHVKFGERVSHSRLKVGGGCSGRRHTCPFIHESHYLVNSFFGRRFTNSPTGRRHLRPCPRACFEWRDHPIPQRVFQPKGQPNSSSPAEGQRFLTSQELRSSGDFLLVRLMEQPTQSAMGGRRCDDTAWFSAAPQLESRGAAALMVPGQAMRRLDRCCPKAVY